jgi:pimeloyl-ACP methyl ester carboxylesterase
VAGATFDQHHPSDAYEGGAGPPLVLLHGLGATWHIWKPVLAILEARHRVVAPTLPGHTGGAPLLPGAEPTVAAMSETLIAQLRRRGIESAHVAGNSLGGWLALELARRGFATSVVVFSPAGAWRTPHDYRKVARPFRFFFAITPLVMSLTAPFLGSAALRRKLARRSMEHGERIPAPEFRAMLRAMGRTRILPTLLKTMGRDGPMAPLASNVPIRIAWGERDRVIPFPVYGAPMLERARRAEHITLPAVGHVPMYDDPRAVATAILAVTAARELPRQEASVLGSLP